jgi:hypothetical protein
MAEPLTLEYMTKAERDARKFSGCWDQGTSGTLAAHVMRLLAEIARLNGELAVQRARYEEQIYHSASWYP